MQTKLIVFFILGFLSSATQASDVIGKTYPIKEVSLLDVMLNKLKQMQSTGEMSQLQEAFKAKALDRIENPIGIQLPKAVHYVKRYFDPSIVVTKDMMLPDGQLLHKAGTRVNPLAIRPLTKRMIFVDATDKQQLVWAKKQYEQSGWRDKVILVNGSYLDVMKDWGKRVYFDQQAKMDGGGRKTLVQHFGIRAVPSVVSQEGNQLKIEEIKI